MSKDIKYVPLVGWAFAWSDANPHPFITRIVSYDRATCIRRVEETMDEPWRKTYRRGGRCIKVVVTAK